MKLFKYNDTPIRTFVNSDGDPLFVLADLCKVLDLSNPSKVATQVDADALTTSEVIDSMGRAQSAKTVTEAGMYQIVFMSRKQEAVSFRRWITHEVLPAIRKTGSYQVNAFELEEHKSKARVFESRAQMELCQAAKGLISDDHLEAKARIILARDMGEAPELDPMRRPLYTQDYLKERGLSGKSLKSTAPVFGKRLKVAYRALCGRDPEKYPMTLPNGRITQVNAYTEADRGLMDEIWSEYYSREAVAA
ncbi:BRO-N domain-containing protein [Rothia koreensis]|uniref:BRO-N domain-containing protein n=1 Tax=Rothia koreensis TaxID=592378 RepID=UPI003FCCFA87